MIKIYNTLTREKEMFIPLEPGKVKMYVCGPTVYNYIHIGNARSTVAFDTVRRYLEYRGYEVNYISNFTDVDDKIIHTAKDLNLTAQEVADRFIEAYHTDTKALGVRDATANPRVMENIPEIIDFIADLIKKDYAYAVDGDVYFRTRKFKKYGQLSGISIDELEVGASNRTISSENDKKEDPLDFALWKAVKLDEISWKAPWGLGRPGWHIECSVMATKYLGDTIDIHAGGQDLSFPHHENEIAQSEAKTGHTFAKYWMHNGFVTMDNEKMSKSLGNFVLVHDMIKKMDPQILRFFMATTHYRRPISYNESTIEDAKTNLNKLRRAFDNSSYRLKNALETSSDDSVYLKQLATLKTSFIEEMDDDFNSANGITIIYELAKLMNIYSENEIVSKVVITAMLSQFEELMQIFGINFGAKELVDTKIEELIEDRNVARLNKDFKKSDEIRELLKTEGIILDDTPQGTRWRRE
ncbi:MAG: cysteine--tRNA ligase [Carnobacterium sp.]|uniref:cysteine--tRNA ligase n=1 Tax=Carnobacterium sp. TaxID=48221 RepID=UPI003C7073E2